NTGGASGGATLMKAIEELEHREVHATAGLVEPLSPDSANVVVLQGAPRKLSAPAEARLFGAATSYSDYALAYHVLIERGKAAAVVAAPEEPEESEASPCV